MLGDAGNIASIVGLLVSLVGLDIAIWQLARLRGETRAAREAAEETRRAVARDLAISDISRINERVQALIEMHRRGEWNRALDTYPSIRKGLIDIRSRYPGLLGDDSERIREWISQIQNIQLNVEATNENVPQETATDFNSLLIEIQSMLVELEIKLQQSG